jgi:hypothetical protein
VKERIRAYSQRRGLAYRQRPEVKEHKKEYQRAYRQRPEVKERERARHQRPDVKEQNRAYRQRPEVTKRSREWGRRRRGTRPASSARRRRLAAMKKSAPEGGGSLSEGIRSDVPLRDRARRIGTVLGQTLARDVRIFRGRTQNVRRRPLDCMVEAGDSNSDSPFINQSSIFQEAQKASVETARRPGRAPAPARAAEPGLRHSHPVAVMHLLKSA